MDGFYLSPGPVLEPGDVFLDVPFPSLKHPLKYFRPSLKEENRAAIMSPTEHPPKDGDTAKGSFQYRKVILLSHGCELDGVQRDVVAKKTSIEKRYWLAAPVLPMSDGANEKMVARIRNGQQPNRFYLPADPAFETAEQFVDLRKITPINVPYFFDAQTAKKKILALSEPARFALQAHLGLFFSGLVLYVQPVPCPNCHAPIDPTTFVIPSIDEDEVE